MGSGSSRAPWLPPEGPVCQLLALAECQVAGWAGDGGSRGGWPQPAWNPWSFVEFVLRLREPDLAKKSGTFLRN